MEKFWVNIAFLLSLLPLILTKQEETIVLGAFLIAVAFSTLYGDKRLNILFILLVFPFVAFNFLPSYILFVVAIVSLSSFYYTSFSYVLIPSGLSLFLLNISDVVIFYVFVGLIISYKLMKYDSRGIIASGIIFLVFSVFISKYQIPLSDLAYFNLLFGTIGTIVESSSVRIPKKIAVPLALSLYPLSTFLFPLPSSYYWWSPSSFLFSHFLSLYIIGYGYNLRLDSFVVYYLTNFLEAKVGQLLALHIIIFLFYLISGFSSYLFFNKNKLLFSFVYSVLTPIQIPSLALSYSLVPLALYLTTKLDLRRFLAFSLITVSAGYVFPFAFTIFSFILGRRKDYVIFSFLISLFWLAPYLIIGFPNENYSFPPLELYILFTLASILSFFTENKYLGLSLVLGSIYLALGLPYSLILYPLIILGILMLSDAKKFIVPLVLISLIVFQGISLYPSLSFTGVPESVQNVVHNLQKNGFGLVHWEGNYSLLSPYPVTNSTNLAKYIVTEINSTKYNVTVNPRYISQPLPLLLSLNLTQIKPPTVENISNSIVSVVNDSIYWEMRQASVESEISIVLPAPENISGELVFNINTTDLQYFEVVIYSFAHYKIFKNKTTIPINGTITLIDLYYYPTNFTVLKVTPILNESGKLSPLFKKVIPFTVVSEKQSSNKFTIYINASVTLNASTISGYYFSVNGSKLVNSTVLKPGYYEIIAELKEPNYITPSVIGSVLGFVLSLVYVLTKEKLVRLYGKVVEVINKLSKTE